MINPEANKPNQGLSAAERKRKQRAAARLAGLCIMCAKSPARPGMSTCKPCADSATARGSKSQAPKPPKEKIFKFAQRHHTVWLRLPAGLENDEKVIKARAEWEAISIEVDDAGHTCGGSYKTADRCKGCKARSEAIRKRNAAKVSGPAYRPAKVTERTYAALLALYTDANGTFEGMNREEEDYASISTYAAKLRKNKKSKVA